MVADGHVALVVDDDPDIALVCALQLEAAGFAVLEAATGSQAVDLARTRLPAVILLDYMLPDVDGIEVMRRLRDDPVTRHIPVVMLTARTHERDRRAAWKAGVSDYVIKPFDGDHLLRAVKDAAGVADGNGARATNRVPAPRPAWRSPAAATGDATWLAGVVEGAHDAIICKTLDGTITYWNRGAERLYGWHASEAVGQHISMLTSVETKDEVPEILLRVGRGETVTLLDTIRLHRDGRRLHVSLCVSPILDEDGGVVGASAIARDISERRRADERFRAVVEAAPDAMVIVAEDGTVELVNAQMVKLFGYEREELIGEKVEMLVPQRFRTRHVGHRRGFRAKASVRPMGAGLELAGLRKDGSEFAIEISLSPLTEEFDVPLTCATIRDVTERRMVEEAKALAAEREREAAARMREVDRMRSDFLSTVSHELRTPLTAIKGFSEWLTGSWDQTPDDRKLEMLRRIHHAGGRLDFLIQDLLDFSRLERGQLRVDIAPLSLQMVVDQAVQHTASTMEGHPVDCEVEPVVVLADQATFLRVLENLLTNAAKFSGPGASIEITSQVDDDQVTLSVRDHGFGIPATEHEKIFDRFYRVPSTAQSVPGTGIGLAIAKQFVEAQGGSVSVHSPEGGGTEFRVHLRAPRTE